MCIQGVQGELNDICSCPSAAVNFDLLLPSALIDSNRNVFRRVLQRLKSLVES
jgi:hypothetical protein